MSISIRIGLGYGVLSMGPLQILQYFKYVWKLAQWNTKILQIFSPCRSGSLVLVCLALRKYYHFLEHSSFLQVIYSTH